MSLLPVDEYRKTRGIHRIGLRSAQPAANTCLEGTLYFVTDEFVIERSNGTIWESYGGPKGEVSFTTTGNIDDLDFTNHSTIRMNNATLATIRGLKAGKAGQKVTIISVGAGIVEFAHQNAGSVAANRLINFATSAPTRLAAGVGNATFQYDDVTDRWRLVDHNQGAFINQAYNAGDFTSQIGTWTVDAGDITTFAYYLAGRILTVTYYLDSTSISDAVSWVGLNTPGGYLPALQMTIGGLMQFHAGVGPWAHGNSVTFSTTAVIRLYRHDFGATAWSVSTNNNSMRGTLSFPVQ